MKAVVLSAGVGTRLRPLTNSWPKPAMPLLGQPLLRYSLGVLRRAGAQWLGINTHHLHQIMEAVASSECRRAGIDLELAHERVIQGTAGGIRAFRKWLEDDPFLVINGDTLFSFELEPLLSAHRSSGALATMVLMSMPTGEPYAAVETDPDGRIWRIAGKGVEARQLEPWHFTGVHILNPEIFDFMSRTGPEDINREVYPRALQQGKVIRGQVVSGYWSDLGTAARYLRTQADLLSGRMPPPADERASPFALARQEPPGCWTRGEVDTEAAAVEGPAFFDRGSKLLPPASAGPNVYLGASSRAGPRTKLQDAAVLDGTALEAGETLIGGIAWGKERLLQFR
jgi:mannose-1-phosphate guanylyltransferase